MTSMIGEREVQGTSEEGVGEILARERIARGLTLEDVAQQLKFGPRQLEALEMDRFEHLPGGTFARGMVRSYARLLKLDADVLLSRMEGKLDVPDSSRLAARFKQPVPFSDASRRSNVVYGILSMLILAIVAGVLIEWKQERAKPARLAFVPAARAPLEPTRPQVASAAPAKAIPDAAPDVASPAPAQPSAEAPESSDTETPAAAPSEAPPAVQEVAPAPAAVVPEKVAASAAAPAAAETRRIVMRFDEESWVEVTDASGRTRMRQLVPADTQRVVSGQPPFALVIGNAHHVRVVYENEPFDLKPYTRGEVARFTLK